MRSHTHTHAHARVYRCLSPLMNATAEHLLNGLIFPEPLRELIGEKGDDLFYRFSLFKCGWHGINYTD